MIELRHVTKRFGARLAVDDLTLRVPAGEVFGLLGHNGAGKSTAIGMMLGQVWPTAGEVRVCGCEVAADRQRALERVGAIFETPAFYDYLSGRRNLELLSHYTARTTPQRIREVIDWVGLTGRETGAVRTYSHGMRARLALAQALLPQPDLLILDEPGEGLDPEGIHELRHMILRLHRELGLTILLSSHLLNEVEQMCTRIAVLREGRKVFEGTLAEAKQTQDWVRMRVGDFGKAVKLLRAAGWLTDERDGQFVTLKDGVGTDQIVRHLVGQGMAVYEIAREEPTLEDFYLALMERSSRGGRPGDPGPPLATGAPSRETGGKEPA
ncbi:MAG: ABC transporter ATP-binding protein [Verrucomicrobia bacterium]|nr:ABC transporter ATP-binding protein [Verrucomicrobiota bacterium]